MSAFLMVALECPESAMEEQRKGGGATQKRRRAATVLCPWSDVESRGFFRGGTPRTEESEDIGGAVGEFRNRRAALAPMPPRRAHAL